MIKTELKVKLPSGLHALNVNLLTELVKDLDCDVFIRANGKMANAKSIVALLALNIKKDDIIEIFIDGIFEEKAKVLITKFFENEPIKS